MTTWRSCANGTTVVLTTHYLEEAQEMCDQIAIINHGAVAACEPTPKLLRRLNYKTLVVRPETELTGVPAAFSGLDASIRKDGQLAIAYKSDATTIEQLLSLPAATSHIRMARFPAPLRLPVSDALRGRGSCGWLSGWSF